MNKNMPSHSEIVEYWKNKGITPDGEVVNLNEIGFDKDVKLVVMDIGEPVCWACDKPISKVYDNGKYYELLRTDPTKIWNFSTVKSSLERAHIVPKAISKNNDVSNLFLLCKECHKQSPDHVNETHFYRFVYNQSKRYIQGINTNVLNDFYQNAKAEGIHIDLNDFKEIDINSERINTHSFDMSPTTILSEIMEVLKENQKKWNNFVLCLTCYNVWYIIILTSW